MMIGLLLMGFALLLAREDRGLIVDEGVTPSERKVLMELFGADPAVNTDVNLGTLHFGTDTVLVAAEVEFADDMNGDNIAHAVSRIEAAIVGKIPAAKHIYIKATDAERVSPGGHG